MNELRILISTQWEKTELFRAQLQHNHFLLECVPGELWNRQAFNNN